MSGVRGARNYPEDEPMLKEIAHLLGIEEIAAS